MCGAAHRSNRRHQRLEERKDEDTETRRYTESVLAVQRGFPVTPRGDNRISDDTGHRAFGCLRMECIRSFPLRNIMSRGIYLSVPDHRPGFLSTAELPAGVVISAT